jgi:hypothetical protein
MVLVEVFSIVSQEILLGGFWMPQITHPPTWQVMSICDFGQYT